MRRTVAWAASVIVLIGLGVALRGAVDFRWPGRKTLHDIDDAAHLLGPFAAIVEQQCAMTREDLGVDVRVVTLRAGGEKVAPLAERLFRERSVGSDSPTGGILIVLDGEGGQARIEVSYSLEGVLPDAIVSRLARDQLAPYASHRAAGMAVMDVVHFLRDRLLDAAASGDLVLADSVRSSDRLSRLLAGHSGGAGAQAPLRELPSYSEFKQRVPDERRARYAPSEDPLESAMAFERAQRDLAGDPTLELFTEGSRVMRAHYPVAPYEEVLRAEAVTHSAPLELQVRGDRAYLGSRRPARGFIPILMVREQGLWRVDLVETFKSFFFDAEGAYRLVNGASPYAVFVADAQAPSNDTLAPLDLRGEPIEVAIARLERSPVARDRFRLAEILMRNCFVSAEAIPLYAEAARGAPHDPTIVLTYADRASYLFMPKIAIEAVAGLGPEHWTSLAWLYESAGERALAREYYAKALRRDPRDGYARSALARLAGEEG
jgi:tetratricopeptide (TPR) repeat protein